MNSTLWCTTLFFQIKARRPHKALSFPLVPLHIFARMDGCNIGQGLGCNLACSPLHGESPKYDA
jgi:hypothetical protein